MSALKKSAASMLVLTLIFVQLFTVFTYSKLWPFYEMTMFAEARFPFSQTKAYFVDPSGEEHSPVLEWTKPFGYFRFSRIVWDTSRMIEKDPVAANKILNDLTKRYATKFAENPSLPRFKSLRIYKCQDCSGKESVVPWVVLIDVPIVYTVVE